MVLILVSLGKVGLNLHNNLFACFLSVFFLIYFIQFQKNLTLNVIFPTAKLNSSI